MPATDVSVVIPVHGNAGTLEELATRIRTALAERLREAIFVDDASPDDSWARIERLHAADARLHGLRLPRNRGQNAAVIAGLAAARGDLCVVLDADLQDPPEAIPTLIRGIDEGADLVFGGRRGQYESFVRTVMSRAFKRAISLLTRGRVPVDAGLFLAMRADVAAGVCKRAGADPYVVVLAAQTAHTIRSIPVERSRAVASSYSSAMRAHVALRALLTALGRK